MKGYIRHITLTTGHTRQSWPGEISDEAVTVCRALIVQITAGAVSETVPIPGQPGYSLGGRATARCMTAIVYADGPPSEPVCTIGVASHSRCGARLWRALHRWGETPVVTDPERCPPEPWVAAALDAGIARHVSESAWLVDFERCLAWAWLAHIGHPAWPACTHEVYCPRCERWGVGRTDRGDRLCARCGLVL